MARLTSLWLVIVAASSPAFADTLDVGSQWLTPSGTVIEIRESDTGLVGKIITVSASDAAVGFANENDVLTEIKEVAGGWTFRKKVPTDDPVLAKWCEPKPLDSKAYLQDGGNTLVIDSPPGRFVHVAAGGEVICTYLPDTTPGAPQVQEHYFRVDDAPPLLSIEAPRFLHVESSTQITANVLEGVPAEGRRIVWSLESTYAQGPSPKNSASGAVSHNTEIKAGVVGEMLRVSARLVEANGEPLRQSPATLEIAAWDLRNLPGPPRRFSPQSRGSADSWADFSYFFSPASVDPLLKAEAGTIILQELQEGIDHETDRIEIQLESRSGLLAFADPRFEPFFRLENNKIAWSGRLPDLSAPDTLGSGSPPVERSIEPGEYSITLSLSYGGETDDVRYDLIFDSVPTALDLEGFFRVRGGAADGWLMRGRNEGGGWVTLQTGPRTAVGGVWQLASPDDLLGARVDLVPANASFDPEPGMLAGLVKTDFAMTGVTNLHRGEREFYGTLGGLTDNTVRLVREFWDVSVITRDSTHWFDPEGQGQERFTGQGRIGGSVARVAFDRKPFDLGFEQAAHVAARVQVLGPDGTVLASVEAGDEPSAAQGNLTIDLVGKLTAEAVWPGRKDDGTPYPAGVYTFVVLFRDGVVEKELRHKAILGNGLKIASVPAQFVPGAEDLKLSLDWIPEGTKPKDLTLTVFSLVGDEREVFRHTVSEPEKDGGIFSISWSRASNASIDWVREAPFRLVVSAKGEDGRVYEDTAQTTVTPMAIETELSLPDNRGRDSRAYYSDDEIPADVGALDVKTTLYLLDQNGRRTAGGGSALVRIKEELQPTGTSDPRSPRAHGIALEGSTGDLQEIRQMPLERGIALATYVPPGRSEYYDYVQERHVAGDSFRLVAEIEGWTGPPVSDQTRWWRIAPGRPVSLTQLSFDEVTEKFGDISRFPSTPHRIGAYVETLKSHAAKLLNDVPGLTQAVLYMTRDHQDITLDYLGVVRNMPFSGLVRPDGMSRRFSMPVYRAGYAGNLHEELRGGQALLVIVEAKDVLGNPVPMVSRRTSDGRERTPLAHLTAEQTGQTTGTTPATLLTYAGQRGGEFVYGGPIIASAYGTNVEAARASPIGTYAFYFLPGYPFSKPAALPENASRFERNAVEVDATSLRAGLTAPEDTSVRLAVTSDGKVIRLDRPIQLARELQPLVSVSSKWLSWLVAGKVDDVDTFKAEIVISVIPILGDGRDLAIYVMKNTFNGEVTGWDDLFAGLALVGLALDAGDLTIVGAVPNAAAAAVKSTAKLIHAGIATTPKMAGAFLDQFSGLAKSALEVVVPGGRSISPDAYASLLREYDRVSRFFEFSYLGMKSGELRKNLGIMSRFVQATCNPHTCVRAFITWNAEVSEYFLRHHEKELSALTDLLRKKFPNDDQVDAARALFLEIMKLSKRMGLDNPKAGAGRQAFMRLISAAADAPNPASIIQKASSLEPAVFRASEKLLGSNAFVGAAKKNDWVVDFLLDEIRRHGTGVARLWDQYPSDSVEDLVKMLGLMRNVPNATSRLRAILENVGAATKQGPSRLGFGQAMTTIADMSRISGDTAGNLLTVLEEIGRLPLRTKVEPILFEDLAAAHRKLGDEGMRIYIESILKLRTTEDYRKGIFEAADSSGSSRNFLNVARQTHGSSIAMELVATRHLLENVNSLRSASGPIPPQLLKLLSNLKPDEIVGLGWKARRGATGEVTSEADTLLDISRAQLGQIGDGTLMAIDWKKYRAGDLPKETDIRKAVDAFINEPGEYAFLMLVSPERWAPQTADEVRRIVRNMGKTEEQADFLLSRFFVATIEVKGGILREFLDAIAR